MEQKGKSMQIKTEYIEARCFMTVNMCPTSYGMTSCFQEVLLEEKILLDWLLYCHLGSEILTPLKAPSKLSYNMILIFLGAILAPAVWKCLWLKQSLSCLSISLEGGRQLCERVGQTVILKEKRLPQSSIEWEKGSSSPRAQIKIQKCSFFFFTFPFF